MGSAGSRAVFGRGDFRVLGRATERELTKERNGERSDWKPILNHLETLAYSSIDSERTIGEARMPRDEPTGSDVGSRSDPSKAVDFGNERRRFLGVFGASWGQYVGPT